MDAGIPRCVRLRVTWHELLATEAAAARNVDGAG